MNFNKYIKSYLFKGFKICDFMQTTSVNNCIYYLIQKFIIVITSMHPIGGGHYIYFKKLAPRERRRESKDNTIFPNLTTITDAF